MHRRHLASTALMRMKIKRLMKMIEVTSKIYGAMDSKELKGKLKDVLVVLVLKLHELDAPPKELFGKLVMVDRKPVTVDDFADQEVPTFF